MSSIILAAGGTGSNDCPGMLNTHTGLSLLSVTEVLGPIILAAVFAYAIIQNPRCSRAEFSDAAAGLPSAP